MLFGRSWHPRQELAKMTDSNPFGFNDHRPFSGLSDELVYGLGPDGTILHISQVGRGLQCGCRCPACEQVLIAKKGPVQLHHFAHHNANAACANAVETNAHIWAKEVLARVKRLLVPETVARHGSLTRIVRRAQVYSFVEARLEKRLGSMVPDVILVMADGKKLIVEVRVTHACDEVKREKLRQDGHSAIEIDLRNFRMSSDREAIEGALLSGAPRMWLSNARQVTFDEQFGQQLAADAEREAKEAEEKRRRTALAEARAAERALQQVEQQATSLMSAVRRSNVSQEIPDFAANLMDTFQEINWSTRSTAGFTVVDAVWQAELFLEYLTDPKAHRYAWEEDITVEHAMQTIGDHLIPAFRSPIPDAVRIRLRKTWPKRRTPAEAVERFLDDLCWDFLSTAHNGKYRVQEHYLDRLERRVRAARAAESRQNDVKSRLAAIIAKLPVCERRDFNFETWHGKKLRAFKISPDDLCRRGDEAFRDFERTLRQVELMLDGGPIAEEMLGLPLGGQVERTQIRIRDTQIKAAAVRRKSLTEAAQAQLGADAPRWLSGPSEDDDELSRIDQAGLDDSSYQRARRELESATRARLAVVRAEAEAEMRRAELQVAAAKFLDKDRANLFMTTTQPKLGRSPIVHCVDQRTLQECLDLLAPAKRRQSR